MPIHRSWLLAHLILALLSRTQPAKSSPLPPYATRVGIDWFHSSACKERCGPHYWAPFFADLRLRIREIVDPQFSVISVVLPDADETTALPPE